MQKGLVCSGDVPGKLLTGNSCTGVVDPGRNPTAENILAFVNCGRSWNSIHCEGVQFMGEIFYCTTKEILRNVEILVYYGDEYAKKINVNPSVRLFV
jgi:hypothetical protein